jgi:HK97 family phage major capsid protein
VRSAEEAGFDENEVNMAQVQIRIYKWTKLVKVSTEFLEDDAANVMDFVMNDLAVKAAQTEDRYVLNGTGTNQHKGIMALVSTEANWLDFDSTGNITADEIPELLYKLNSAYRANASWFMHNSVEAYLRKIRDTSLFAFQPVMDLANGLSAWSQLLGRPVFNEANMTSSLATGNQVIMVGDMSYYAIAERKGLVVSRNPYLYENSGQVGIFAHFRQGGAPLQYEAFAIGEMA